MRFLLAFAVLASSLGAPLRIEAVRSARVASVSDATGLPAAHPQRSQQRDLGWKLQRAVALAPASYITPRLQQGESVVVEIHSAHSAAIRSHRSRAPPLV